MMENAINTLIDGLKNKYEDVRESYAKSLGVISEKLNEKQLENVINTLIDGLKDKDKSVRESYAKSLGVISTNLTDKQLEGVFNALPNDLEYDYFNSYSKALEEISTKWNDKQSERVFNALIFLSKHSMDANNNKHKDKLLVQSLKLISTKLNDKQLYLLVIHLLERAKKKCSWGALSKISEDMWKRATIGGLKENIKMKHENTLMNKQNSNNDADVQLLVVGLMTVNPRIQLSCNDDNINFDALNELIRYCNVQVIEWTFPTNQSTWNNSIGDIEYPCLNNEIEQ
ncbi:PBS lyase HEAT domain-containing protein repeat-containing protein, partial [Reticulomyxa filosa]